MRSVADDSRESRELVTRDSHRATRIDARSAGSRGSLGVLVFSDRRWHITRPRTRRRIARSTRTMLRLSVSAAALLAVAQAGAPSIRSGQGDFVYEYQSDKLRVPPSPQSGGDNVLNGHAVAVDNKGNIFFTYVTLDTYSLATVVLIQT